MTRNGSEILGSNIEAQGDNQLVNVNGLTLTKLLAATVVFDSIVYTETLKHAQVDQSFK